MSGDHITFKATDSFVPGIYDVRVCVNKNINRGICQLTTGNDNQTWYNIGSPFDMYDPSSSGVFDVIDLGNLTFGLDGARYFKFTIVGQNPSAGAPYIGLDYIQLTPVS